MATDALESPHHLLGDLRQELMQVCDYMAPDRDKSFSGLHHAQRSFASSLTSRQRKVFNDLDRVVAMCRYASRVRNKKFVMEVRRSLGCPLVQPGSDVSGDDGSSDSSFLGDVSGKQPDELEADNSGKTVPIFDLAAPEAALQEAALKLQARLDIAEATLLDILERFENLEQKLPMAELQPSHWSIHMLDALAARVDALEKNAGDKICLPLEAELNKDQDHEEEQSCCAGAHVLPCIPLEDELNKDQDQEEETVGCADAHVLPCSPLEVKLNKDQDYQDYEEDAGHEVDANAGHEANVAGLEEVKLNKDDEEEEMPEEEFVQPEKEDACHEVDANVAGLEEVEPNNKGDDEEELLGEDTVQPDKVDAGHEVEAPLLGSWPCPWEDACADGDAGKDTLKQEKAQEEEEEEEGEKGGRKKSEAGRVIKQQPMHRITRWIHKLRAEAAEAEEKEREEAEEKRLQEEKEGLARGKGRKGKGKREGKVSRSAGAAGRYRRQVQVQVQQAGGLSSQGAVVKINCPREVSRTIDLNGQILQVQRAGG